jgi:hypothetical protein
VIATETEARVTDVTRLEAKTAQNEAGITDVRQALATETEARFCGKPIDGCHSGRI